MRILMVEPSGKAGICTYSDGLCRGLHENRADVTMLTSPPGPSEQSPYPVLRSLRPIHPLKPGCSRLRWALDRATRVLGNCIARDRCCVALKPDVVHLQLLVPVVDQFFLRHLTASAPCVLTVHDVAPHAPRFASSARFVQRCLHLPHRLIVHHERAKQILIEHWQVPPHRIDVIPHGLSPLAQPPCSATSRQRLGLPQDRRVVLFFGTIRHNKGLSTLLEALAVARQQAPDILLVIAGEPHRGVDFGAYERTIEKLGLQDHVHRHVGFIAEDCVDDFFAAADVVALPYLSFESQSGVLLRAFAHRRPVVASRVGGMGELVDGDGVGLTAAPGDATALAAALSRIATHSDVYRARFTPELMQKYAWNHIAQSTLESYRAALREWPFARTGTSQLRTA